ncbi:type II secretion system F family protein [Cyanobium sp. HWJ4-Hawea]|uniref:type II secretion system F family protein n=1 Tax=Cyanobium sp. HWJ4-Hawea TaxID=2823713 RepID=UPI0020CD5B00|nr:type II secretion system F family protein [Cyanobium sp. HWJ4-Hawea]MCP9808105.1 type II secretion system F family protein [Cyanobium sp. HWJ4-Hawea]
MARFVSTYVGKNGEPRQLRVEAVDWFDAKRQLRRRGIRASQLELLTASQPPGPDISGSSGGFMQLERLLEARPGIREKALFANKLAAMVDAGVPIVRSLDLLAAQQKMPLFKRSLVSLCREVNEGSSLGAAMRAWPQVFDRLTVAMVEAGEAGGVMDESLKRLAKLLEDNAKLQNQIKGALGYPMAVLLIAVLVFLGMTIFLIPTFSGIFEDLGAQLPPFTQLMVTLSQLLRSIFSIFAAAALLLGGWLFSRYYASAHGRRRIDGWLLKLPLFGDLLQKTATAQFCRAFSSLTRAGVPILYSLEIVREIAGNILIADAITASRNEVQEGMPLSLALSRKKVFPEMALSMLAIGEETGGMDTMLSKVADFYEDEVGAAVKALTAMLEPAMIVVVGGIVGSILLAMYLPMFSIFDQIK